MACLGNVDLIGRPLQVFHAENLRVGAVCGRMGKLGCGGLNLLGRPLHVCLATNLRVGSACGRTGKRDAEDLTRLAGRLKFSMRKTCELGRCAADGKTWIWGIELGRPAASSFPFGKLASWSACGRTGKLGCGGFD